MNDLKVVRVVREAPWRATRRGGRHVVWLVVRDIATTRIILSEHVTKRDAVAAAKARS